MSRFSRVNLGAKCRKVRDILDEVKSMMSRRTFLMMVLPAIIVALVLLAHRGYVWHRQKEIPAKQDAPFGYVRLPNPHEENAFQTVPVMRGKEFRFSMPVEHGQGIEVGVVRTGDMGYFWGYHGRHRLKVYRKKRFRKDAILEETRAVNVNERVGFRIGDEILREARQPLESIVCEIEKEQADNAKGYDAQKDFKFLVPNILSKREPGEFNVLLISFDTLRADHLGCYGYHRNTSPNIDEFANESILFKQAISPAPVTLPAHYSLLSGLLPTAHKQHIHKFLNPFSKFSGVLGSSPARTLVGALRDDGYYTVAFTGGVTLSSIFGFADGFNVYNEYCSYKNTNDATKPWDHDNDTEKTFNEAIKWLQKNPDLKFFMFLHTFECHIPYEGTFFLPAPGSGSLIEKRIALYDGDIRNADHHFGILMQALNELGLMENTIIVFLSDHGEDFYDHYREADVIPPVPDSQIVPEFNKVDHGHSLYDELIHVPLIIYVPGLRPEKGVVDGQVRLIDVMPTILDLLEIECSEDVQGVSFRKILETGSGMMEVPAVSECTPEGPERKSMRMDGYKYVWIPSLEPSIPSITFRNLSQYELFDLESDPGEKKNIFDEKRELAEKYHRILEERIEESDAIYGALLPKQREAREKAFDVPTDVGDALKALGYID